jgi:hypothetical protein
MPSTRFRDRRPRWPRWGPSDSTLVHDQPALRTWTLIGAIVVVLLLAIVLLGRRPVINTSRPGQIILIRHGEKPADQSDAHLSPAGVRRAEQLVAFITTDSTMMRFGLPVALFATQTTKNNRGYRTQETLEPLATTLQLPVQTPLRGKDYAAVAQLILANPAYAGKTVVIAWNHEQITQLTMALGVTPEPPEWSDTVFDRVYVISYHDGKATLAISRYDSR